MHSRKNTIAAFDFDGTLTLTDTFLPFLWYCRGCSAFIRQNAILLPVWAKYISGQITNEVAKEQIIEKFLGGIHVVDLKGYGELFAKNIIPWLVRRRGLEQLKYHLQAGHRCIIVSASPEIYIRPWAEMHGVFEVLATRLLINDQGEITGKLKGRNCYGSEKKRRVEELIGNQGGYTLFAYGDSRGDKELLDFADFGYLKTFPLGKNI